MKNKIVIGLAAFALAGSMLMGVAVSASAGETSHSKLKGGFAIAVWGDSGTYSGTPTDTFGVVEYFEYWDYLIIITQTVHRDAQGNITGYTERATDANGARYGTFTIDKN